MNDRAQTTIDFGIGAGVFLVAVAFAVAFIPTMMVPFQTGPQEETVAADRIANTIGGGMLGDPSSPSVLDPTCTAAFFDGVDGGSGCDFSGPLREQLGISDRIDVAVSISDDAAGLEPLCLEPDGTVGKTVPDLPDEEANCATVFDRKVSAPLPSDRGSIITARRTVSVGGVRGSLVVQVW